MSAADRLAARLVWPGDERFEQARVGRVFNQRRPDRQPAAVLLAASVDDVVAGVELAGERGWQVAVRAGGHSWAAWSVRDETLLVDLAGLHEYDYDDATGIASATPSVKGGAELAPYLASLGRFFNGGHCPPVGIGGFLLQGGQGWCARGWGWAAESVVAVDAVTAAGELVRADATQNSDLYWAARGAGPSFPAIVTRFHLQTRPHPGHVAETAHVYSLDDFDAVMTWLHDIHHTISPHVEIVVISATPPVPIPGHGGGHVLVVTGVALVDTPEQAVEALAPFATCPVIDRALQRIDAAPVTFDELRARQLAANPDNHRYRVDNAWLTGTAADVVPAMRRLYCELPSPKSFTIWFSMAPLRELPDMALSLQSEIYASTYVVYEDEAQDDAMRAWVASAMADVEPVSIGQYLGDADLENRAVKFMSDEAFARLAAVRARWDPHGRFVTYLADRRRPVNHNHWEST